MSKKIIVAGIGPGDRGYILPAVDKSIEECDVVIGGRRNLEAFGQIDREKLIIGNNLEDICQYIQTYAGVKAITVLATGDPGIFSIMEYLKGKLEGIEMTVIPGISSFQYLCSKLKLSWDDVRIVSLHGRDEEDLTYIVRENRKVIVFTGGTTSPGTVCKNFIKDKLTNLKITVGENLSYSNEKIVNGTPEEISEMVFGSLSVMLVQNEEKDKDKGLWNYATAGIPDELFLRGEVPMTKQEIRAVTISKLQLDKRSIVYDIGAGTGSISIECGLICSKGKIYAIEREKDALELIKANVQKFSVKNVQIVEGEAPSVLETLPLPDRVFIGGSGGKMEKLLELIRRYQQPVKVVINAVAIETAYEAIRCLEEKGFDNVDIVNLSVSRGRTAGGKHLMQALNPIYIISAQHGGSV